MSSYCDGTEPCSWYRNQGWSFVHLRKINVGSEHRKRRGALRPSSPVSIYPETQDDHASEAVDSDGQNQESYTLGGTFRDIQQQSDDVRSVISLRSRDKPTPELGRLDEDGFQELLSTYRSRITAVGLSVHQANIAEVRETVALYGCPSLVVESTPPYYPPLVVIGRHPAAMDQLIQAWAVQKVPYMIYSVCGH